MATTDVLSWDKKKAGQVELSADVFEAPLRKDLLHTVVRWQLACRRQGTHKTKTKGLVRGGGKKPFKQKGTGNARQGSTRSPLMPGGGTVFGPQPRDYSYTVPKKIKRAALCVALSHLNREGKLFVVDGMDSEGKTNELFKRLKGFGVQKAVLIDGDVNENFQRAAKNLADFRYYGVAGLNVYDLLKYDTVILTKESLEGVVNRCKAGN